MRSLLPNPGRYGGGLFSRLLQPFPSRVFSASTRPSTAIKDLFRSPCSLPRSPFTKGMQKLSLSLMLRFPAEIEVGVAGAMPSMVVMREPPWPPFRSAKKSTKLEVGGDEVSTITAMKVLVSSFRKTRTLIAALALDKSDDGTRQEGMDFTLSVGVVLVRTGQAAGVGMPTASSGHHPNLTDLMSRGYGGLGLIDEKAIQGTMVSGMKEVGSYGWIPSSTGLMEDGSEVLVARGVSVAATNSAVCPGNPASDGFGPGGGKLGYGLESIMGSGPKIGF